MTPSLPLVQSHLLCKIQDTCVFEKDTYSMIRDKMSTNYSAVEIMNSNLLEQFYKMADGQSIMVTVDRVQQTMADMMKVLIKRYASTCTCTCARTMHL